MRVGRTALVWTSVALALACLAGTSWAAEGDSLQAAKAALPAATGEAAQTASSSATAPRGLQVWTGGGTDLQQWDPDTLLSIDAESMQAVELINYLAKMAGLDIVVSPGCESTRVDTVTLRDRTAREIITAVAAYAQPPLSVTENDKGMLVIQPMGTATGPSPLGGPPKYDLATMDKPLTAPGASAEASKPAEFETRTYQLQYLNVEPVAKMLGGQAYRLQSDFTSAIRQTGDYLAARGFRNAVAKAATNRIMRESAEQTPVFSMAGLDSASFGQRGGNMGGGNMGGRGGGGNWGGGNQGGRGGGGLGGGGLGGGGLGGGLGGGMGGNSFFGLDQLAALGVVEQNTLILYGPPEEVARAIEVLRSIDKPAKQVLIEVQVVDVNLDRSKNLGVNWALTGPNMTMTAQYGGDSAGNLNIAFVNGDARVLISALTTDSRGDLISSPRIQAMNNTNAYIFVGEVIPTFIPQRSTDIGGNIIVTWEPGDDIETGVELSVTPQINADNSVTMLLEPSFEEVGAAVVAGSGDTATTTYRELQREFSTILRVRDGQTIVLGGLTRRRNDDNRYRVPGLADIPIIGALFRGRSQTISESELLWFVTPRVIHDFDEAPDL